VPVLALLFLLACVDPNTALDPADTATIVFEVKSGSTPKGLGPALETAGLVSSASDWSAMFGPLGGNVEDCGIKAGKHGLSRSMSMMELLTEMCGAPLADDVPFTVVEGWRIRDIDAALVGKGWIEAGEYITVATSKDVTLPFEVPSATLEGYLYPETYMVPSGDQFSVKGLIERQLATLDERFISTNPNLGKRTMHEVIVMASMLEREEPTVGNRPIVAGILWKRLDHDWKLGVDATSRYTIDKWNDRKAFLVQLRDPDDVYNTRLRNGLPPTAIGNPSLESLQAAVQPKESPYWYYLHDPQGGFHGSKDGDEHDRTRKKYGVY
jgi:UPF0755 protein